MSRIIVSACLAGINCRYDGKNNHSAYVEKLVTEGKALPVCPEQLGGLTTPREPAEIIIDKTHPLGFRVLTIQGKDVTEAFRKGAEETLHICKLFGIKNAIFQLRSPSCGIKYIYDGTFSKSLIRGNGVIADYLLQNGIEVIGWDADSKGKDKMSYLLGLDIGTSGTKTVLFDEKGTTIASALKEYPLDQPQSGWAEQDPQDWWQATVATIRETIDQGGISPGEIGGIGLSGQMHGMVLLDKNGQVLRPSIIWCDQRTTRECEEITNLVGAERLIEITANPALTGFTASKVMWVKHNQPEIFEKIHKILLPKDYIRFKLTGEFATEVSDASGTQFLDVPNRCWSKEVLSTLGIDRNWMPAVYESTLISGKISKQAADMTGLCIGTPVAGGGGDQAAGAVGNAVVKPGIISSTIGTSGVVFAHMDEVAIDLLGRVHTFCHAVPGKWHVMGVTQGAGLSLQWMRNQFGGMEKELATHLGIDPYVIMTEEAAKACPGCQGLIYLPYLMGERTPHLDPDARGVFFGLTARHKRSDMIRAVMEGVAYSLHDCLGVIMEMGVPVQQVTASGGGGKSILWRQMQADMFQMPISTINSSEGPALGAALLAGVGIGIYDDVPQACETAIHIVDTVSPIAENEKIYEKYYPLYRSLYHSLQDQFKIASDIDKDKIKQ